MTDTSWIAPSNIAGNLKNQLFALRTLAEVRTNMSPEVNQHLDNLQAAVEFLEKYAADCRRGQKSATRAGSPPPNQPAPGTKPPAHVLTDLP